MRCCHSLFSICEAGSAHLLRRFEKITDQVGGGFYEAPVCVRQTDIPLANVLLQFSDGQSVAVELGIVAGDEYGGTGTNAQNMATSSLA